jgi:uncharacterized protein YecA (UPF0149 family)
MEDILYLYHRPYDPEIPLICMDEKPVQLLGDSRESLPATPQYPPRYDYEHTRNGTASIFLFTEPLKGWRKVNPRKHRKKVDWAHEVRELLVTDYPNAKKIILVCDNLNTHMIGAFYEAFPPEEASNLVKRLEIHNTPVHGSWLNIAEIELSALSRQSLDRRIDNLDTLVQETKRWESARNKNQNQVDWQFTSENARIKLKRLYPQF